MASTPAHEIYPQYCFHKSPTITTWCRLRTSDIAKLWSPPGFEGQDVFFYNNHPIKWVRIAGVVVAVDEYTVDESSVRRVYTVDDSSGINIECVAQLAAKQPRQLALDAPSADFVAQQRQEQQPQQQQQKDPFDLDLGQVVEIRGGLKLFRTRYEARLQIKIEKVKPLPSTQHEVDFWKETAKLHEETLSRPWVLDERVLRRCRRKAEEDDLRATKKKKKQKNRTENASDHAPRDSSNREDVKKAPGNIGDDDIHRIHKPAVPVADGAVPRLVTGLERKGGIKKTSSSSSGDGLHYRHNSLVAVPAADSAIPKPITGLERKQGAKKTPSSSSSDGLHYRHNSAVAVSAADSASPKLITGLERKRRHPKAERAANLEGRPMART